MPVIPRALLIQLLSAVPDHTVEASLSRAPEHYHLLHQTFWPQGSSLL